MGCIVLVDVQMSREVVAPAEIAGLLGWCPGPVAVGEKSRLLDINGPRTRIRLGVHKPALPRMRSCMVIVNFQSFPMFDQHPDLQARRL
jgi:hypothetical protein